MLIGGRGAAQEIKSTWLSVLMNSTYLWPAFFSIAEWKFMPAFIMYQHIHNHPWVFVTKASVSRGTITGEELIQSAL